MKFHLLATTAFVCATSSSMCMMLHNQDLMHKSMEKACEKACQEMEKDKSRLNFLLNHEWHIQGNSAENMAYEVDPSDFLGKKITEAVPLSDEDKYAIAEALTKAAQNQKTEEVAYVLNNKKFLAKVTPIIKADQKCNFFLKVKEKENCIK